ncbi:MAG: hypothetical protein RLZ53_255 [Actinomycetota bacterium]|jgi:phosphoglycolate phosphatase
MSKFTTILWDLDGTIIDSSPGVFESFNRTFKTLSLPQLTDEQMRPFMGPPLSYTFGQVLGFEQELVQECLKIYRDFYLNQGGALNATVFPGVIDTLEKIQAAGIPQSLATSKALVGTTLVGEHFDFLKYFDVLGTASNDLTRNSKSQVLDYALGELQKLGADLSKPLLIGDRIHDIEGAREHGIEVCLVKWGFGTEEEFAQADFVVENADELQALVLSA